LVRLILDSSDGSYPVVIGSNIHRELRGIVTRLDPTGVAIITDTNVRPWAVKVSKSIKRAGLKTAIHVIPVGERSKSMTQLQEVLAFLERQRIDRGGCVIAVGGGTVGDLAGFAAAVWQRGVRVIGVPTTLLAMVDSAIGGKTGVNLPEGKNLAGAFHQPLAVLADPGALATLSDREYRSGLGEIAKYALIGDDFVSARTADLVARDPSVLAEVIARSAAIKARYVGADELERTGTRAVLNYGHTLAHALETASGHALLHGEAVAIGLVFAAQLAGTLERIDQRAVAQHEELIGALGLPTHAPPGLRGDDLVPIMARDKKSDGGLTFMLAGPRGIERVDDPDPAAVRKALAAIGIEG
jgi:3-dehydroquinate synthase